MTKVTVITTREELQKLLQSIGEIEEELREAPEAPVTEQPIDELLAFMKFYHSKDWATYLKASDETKKQYDANIDASTLWLGFEIGFAFNDHQELERHERLIRRRIHYDSYKDNFLNTFCSTEKECTNNGVIRSLSYIIETGNDINVGGVFRLDLQELDNMLDWKIKYNYTDDDNIADFATKLCLSEFKPVNPKIHSHVIMVVLPWTQETPFDSSIIDKADIKLPHVNSAKDWLIYLDGIQSETNKYKRTADRLNLNNFKENND